MRLGYDLTLEQAQKLVMTPELRQAIQLLQYNSLELNEYLEIQMESNPMLEVANNSIEHENIEELGKEAEDIDWKEFLGKYDDISYTERRDKNIKEVTYENFISYSPSLKEYLLSQLNLTNMDEKEKNVGQFIIESVDENGYLAVSLDSIAEELGVSFEYAENVLFQIQTFDPVGVGARDLKECLIIQLIDRKIEDPNVFTVVENYLEDIANNRMMKISKELNIDIKEVQKICDVIRSLEPKPGRGFGGSSDNIRYIVPDITLQHVDGEYIVVLNDVTGPRLNINSFYKELVSKTNDPQISQFLNSKLNSALWVIKSIEQRRTTIYRVVKSILKFQLDFFEKGEKFLKPLTLKEVADDIGVHESTVSRATNGKYMQTPRGVFELKYFFSSGVSGEKGDVSAISIKSTLKDLIENENHKKPLSDQQISNLLKEKGISISRRTVAKYREEMNIASSSMRRRF
ncbi:RNA polymerase sigma-54 factor [Acidilutibacter cellobiosedens]|jgi:RNA polymerase sigma-54 factor|uniref:RNA polymerase sigma-54 factor n=1 Tax=Acidilutibacter cellobiosedens TaxID=2507161 RepID=A0A410QEM2_9FIRM|nr:RNA polymerase factor sigma-54 [Acidilutibacter cellobiosedens]MBE6081608.1 RNA polymerase factor sigma-54 [Tissierellaceae bacterium]QAT62415.1 RNA polymerase sigma-54 factor [Acidilutibacter cellobiosedens]